MFQEHDDVLAQLDESKKQLRQLTSENERMRQNVASLKETVEILPSEVEAMSRDEFEVLCTENATLIEKNCSLEDQLVSKPLARLLNFDPSYWNMWFFPQRMLPSRSSLTWKSSMPKAKTKQIRFEDTWTRCEKLWQFDIADFPFPQHSLICYTFLPFIPFIYCKNMLHSWTVCSLI